MRRLAVISPLLILGLALVFLNDRAASWYDGYFHGEEVSLSHASELLKEGRAEDYENVLKQVLMVEKGSGIYRALALYNLGCSSLDKATRGDEAAFKNAFFYFKEALRNNPSLFPAKYNLELLMRMIENRNKKETGRRPSKGEKEDKGAEGSTDKVPTTAPPHLGDRP